MNSILATSIEFANLGIKLNNVGKSISIFGVDIAYYGMIIATGMILGIIVTCAEAKRTGQDPNDYIDFAIYAIIFSVIGARLYYVIFSWDYYKKNPGQILNIRGGGLAIYGGICFVKEIIRISTYNINKKNGIYFIIAAKNQENNIEEFIRTTLFRIVYGKEESINNITLVDLKSKDNTKNIMEEIARENENVKVFSINEYKKIIEDM